MRDDSRRPGRFRPVSSHGFRSFDSVRAIYGASLDVIAWEKMVFKPFMDE